MILLQGSDMKESKDMLCAVELLKKEGYTMVAVKDCKTLSDRRRGVAPLLSLLDKGENLRGYSVADKVIGKAAAFLYVLLEAEYIYALTVSEAALQVFEEHGISIIYEEKADMIHNRDKTGRCPMEQAVLCTDSAEEAVILIRNKLNELTKNHNH